MRSSMFYASEATSSPRVVTLTLTFVSLQLALIVLLIDLGRWWLTSPFTSPRPLSKFLDYLRHSFLQLYLRATEHISKSNKSAPPTNVEWAFRVYCKQVQYILTLHRNVRHTSHGMYQYIHIHR
jgi:hypothetical protein